MSPKKIKDFLIQGYTMLYFKYNGKECHVDPYYIEGKGECFLLWCDGTEMEVSGIDKAMQTPFWSGKSLNEILDKITDIDY